MEKISKKQLDDFYQITNKITAIGYYNSFCNDVKSGKIKLDGSNHLLTLVDKYVLKPGKNNLFIKKINKNTIFYRARIARDEDIIESKGFRVNIQDGVVSGFDESNSREAPLGTRIPAGRNNIMGMSYLYLADSIGTACVEVKPSFYDIISVALFKNKRSLRIIDFSNINSDDLSDKDNDERVKLSLLFSYIMSSFTIPVNDEDLYIIPQFLSDYIRKAGYDGIAYKSFYDKKGINYTIFNSHRSYFEYYNSEVYMMQSKDYHFLDINNNEIVSVESLIGKETDEELYEQVIDRLNKMIITKHK